MNNPFGTATTCAAKRALRRLAVAAGLTLLAPAAGAVPVPFVDVIDPVTKPLLFGPASPPNQPFNYLHSIVDDGFVPGSDTIIRVPPVGPQLFPVLEILLDDDPLGPSQSDPQPEQVVIVTDFDASSPFIIPIATDVTGTYNIAVDMTKLADGLLAVTIDLEPDVFASQVGPLVNDLYFISSTLSVIADVDVPEPAPLAGLAMGVVLLAASARRRAGAGR